MSIVFLTKLKEKIASNVEEISAGYSYNKQPFQLPCQLPTQRGTIKLATDKFKNIFHVELIDYFKARNLINFLFYKIYFWLVC